MVLPSCLHPLKLSEQKGGERSWLWKGVRYRELQRAILTHTSSLMPGQCLRTSFRESLSPGCSTTSLPLSSPPFPFSFLLSKPLTPSSVVGGRAFSHSSHPTPHPRHLTPTRNGFLQGTCRLSVSLRSLAPRILPGSGLGAESADRDSGNSFPPIPTQLFRPGEGALLPLDALSPHTCSWPLGGACLSVRGHPGLSFILASQGRQRESLPSPSNPSVVGSSGLRCASARGVSLFLE